MKIKYLLLGLLTPLLYGVSFANTYLDDLENYVISSWNFTFTTNNLYLWFWEINSSNSEDIELQHL